MKATFRRGWQSLWRIIDDYILLDRGAETPRERVLFALEQARQFFTPSPAPKKKRHRLLRRWLPSIACLVLGFSFASMSQVAHAGTTVPTQARVGQSSQQATQPRERAAVIGTPCSTTNADPLTGLPQPGNGGDACTLPVPEQSCTITAVSPGLENIQGWPLGLLIGTDMDTVTQQHIANYEPYILGVAIALLVIPLLLAGYQIMLGTVSTHYAGAIEILARVILVLLLALLSYTLISLLLQLESQLGATLFGDSIFVFPQTPGPTATQVYVPASGWCVNAQNFFGELFNLTSYDLQNVQQSIDSGQYLQGTYTTTLALINGLPTDVLTLLSILLTCQLLIRLALLNFYILGSPLAIICGALPGEAGPAAARAWVKGLLALLFVQILQLVVLLAAGGLFPTSLTTGTDWLSDVLNKLLPIVILIVVLNIPRLLNVSATGLLTTVSSSISGAMTGVILIMRGF